MGVRLPNAYRLFIKFHLAFAFFLFHINEMFFHFFFRSRNQFHAFHQTNNHNIKTIFLQQKML